MKITRKLLEKMVREEISNIGEGSGVSLDSWQTPRLLSALMRLVAGSPLSDRTHHQLAMKMIDQLIKNEGPGKAQDLSTPAPTGFEE